MPYYNKLSVAEMGGRLPSKHYMIPSFVQDVTIIPDVVGGIIDLWLLAPALVDKKIQTIKILRELSAHLNPEYDVVNMSLKEAKFHVDLAYDILCDYAPDLIPDKPQLP